MKKRDILKQLNREFDSLTPDASDDLIAAPIACEKREPKPAPRRRNPFSFGRVAASVAALAVTVGIVAAVVAFFPQTSPAGYIKNDTFISLSINPAVTVIADSDGKVVEVKTKNRDAEILLAGTDRASLIGRDYDYAVGYLTEEAVDLGFFANARGLSAAAVSCGGADKTAAVVGQIKADAESVLVAKGVAAPVTVSALDRVDILAAAASVDPQLQGDEDLEDLLEILARDADYMQKFGGEIALLFGDNADASVQTLYQMELLDDYVELLDDRREFLTDLSEFNVELAAEETAIDAFALKPGDFSAPDGWWLSWYAADNESADEELSDLAEEFGELFEDYDEYELDGLTPLLPGNLPNVAAADRLSAYLSVCTAVDFEALEEYADELEDLLDDLSETNYEKIAAKFDELQSELAKLGADWADYAASRGKVDGVEDYLQKTEQNILSLYESMKAAAAVGA